MGLDIGDRRIGVALSDPTGILASPFSIIERTDDPAATAAIIDIVRRREVKLVVIGLPRSLDGTAGTQAEKVRAFAQKLSAQVDVPVEFRDERLSTVSARRLLHDAGKKRGKGKVRDDAAAAAIILQSYLEEGRFP